ncbi:MAG: translation initiation factor IF-2 [Candidatus Omnitrophica bacterium]|jgi:translation initiation factor IF-2|nr:translation initiation factor IF-2 [Candidatus Omnitrophota bacterium]
MTIAKKLKTPVKAVVKEKKKKPPIIKVAKPKAVKPKQEKPAVKKIVKKKSKIETINPVVASVAEVKPVTVVQAHPKAEVKPSAHKTISAPKPEIAPKPVPVPALKTQVPVPKVEPVEQKPVVSEAVVPELKEIEIDLPVNVKDLSVRLQIKPSVLIKMLMDMRIMAGINQNLPDNVVSQICQKLGFVVKAGLAKEEKALFFQQKEDAAGDLLPRAPIVTMMGHVDHGKTSLLDAIRKTRVVESEHGGITQHIGAYLVKTGKGEVTFLDTPGHEAFTAMRARGAGLTDIVILVVAADDGIMPQTKEAIDHAKAAGVCIVVALNKIDKAQAEPERVKKQLAELGLMSEDWGGKTIVVPVSAKTGQGIDQLLEMVLLEAELLQLKANPNRLAKGAVVEAKMSKGRGPVATLLVQNGTLRLNDNIVVGNSYGKIRAMSDHLGRPIQEASPAHPVEVLGLDSVPEAGEIFYVMPDERQAKELVGNRNEERKQSQVKQIRRISLEDLHTQIKEGKIKELKVVLKADMQGSLEAIKDLVAKIDTAEIKLEVIHADVGNINYSDIILAVASNALVLGFNVVQDDRAKELSSHEEIDVRIYNIIYELANDIKLAIEGMLEPKLKKVFMGKAQVKKMFKLSRSGNVAGCVVSKGKISRSSSITVMRNGEQLFDGTISALKRFKDDVREVAEGFECGITLNGFDKLQEGDVLESYITEKIARKL